MIRKEIDYLMKVIFDTQDAEALLGLAGRIQQFTEAIPLSVGSVLKDHIWVSLWNWTLAEYWGERYGKEAREAYEKEALKSWVARDRLLRKELRELRAEVERLKAQGG